MTEIPSDLDWTFQGMAPGEALADWLDRVHPLQYDTSDGPFFRCPTCEEWSPCSVRTHVAKARAAGANEGYARRLKDGYSVGGLTARSTT